MQQTASIPGAYTKSNNAHARTQIDDAVGPRVCEDVAHERAGDDGGVGQQLRKVAGHAGRQAAGAGDGVPGELCGGVALKGETQGGEVPESWLSSDGECSDSCWASETAADTEGGNHLR